MGRVWLICCRTISWLLSGLFLLCPGSVPPSRSRSLPTQSHTGQQQVHRHFKQKLQLIITAISAHEDGWRTNPSYSDKVSTMCQVICEPRMVKINNTTAPRESAQNVWSCASSDVNKVQLRCQAESVYLTARFNKISTYSSAILCPLFLGQCPCFEALVAENAVLIVLHLISSPSLCYLAQHHWAANGRWATARRLRRTREHGKRSLNHALTTWSFLAPPLPPASSTSISCCCILMRP